MGVKLGLFSAYTRGFRFQPFSGRSANFVLNNKQNIKLKLKLIF